jgi:glycosyltransferase involved in cell wall biosynthesis
MLAPGLGGLEQSLVDYCEALLLEGHPVEAVVHPRWADLPALARLPLAAITPLTTLNEWDPFAVHRLRRRLRAAPPAVVLTIGRRASVLTRRARRRLPPLPQVGVTPNYSLAPLIGLDHVIATTRDLRQAAIAAGQPAARVSVVPNRVRLPADTVPAAEPSAAPVIGALGRMIERKGFADLLAAAALLAARGRAFEVRLGGSGPAEAALRALADRLALGDRVRFLGWVEDKPAFFGALDVFCVPSRMEPFGIVVLEGMAHGRAVVASTAAGPREILRDGIDGLLVPPAAPPALADALGALLDDPERRAALARAGRETVRARFDLPVVATTISAVLTQVASGDLASAGGATTSSEWLPGRRGRDDR